MKEILLDEAPQDIHKCFEHSEVILYLWQTGTKEEDRVIFPSLAERLNKEKLEVSFRTRDYSHYELRSDEVIYCFNEDLKAFFKLEQLSVTGNQMKTKVPSKISILTEEENLEMNEALYQIHASYLANKGIGVKTYTSDGKMVYEGPRESIDLGIMKIKGHVAKATRSQHDMDLLSEHVSSVSLDEEDKMYADQRNSPRAKPKADKTVTILDPTSSPVTYKLYDLSMGGMSLIAEDITDLNKDDEISVLGFDDKLFQDPLKGIIRNIRDIEEMPGSYKVGFQFLE